MASARPCLLLRWRRAPDCGRGTHKSRSCRARAAASRAWSPSAPRRRAPSAPALPPSDSARSPRRDRHLALVRQDHSVQMHRIDGAAFAGSDQRRQRLEHRDLGKPHLAGRRRCRHRGGGRLFGECRIGFLRRGKFLRQGHRGWRTALGAGVLGRRHQRQLRPCPKACGHSKTLVHSKTPAHSKTPSAKAAFTPQNLTPQLSHPRAAAATLHALSQAGAGIQGNRYLPWRRTRLT